MRHCKRCFWPLTCSLAVFCVLHTTWHTLHISHEPSNIVTMQLVVEPFFWTKFPRCFRPKTCWMICNWQLQTILQTWHRNHPFGFWVHPTGRIGSSPFQFTPLGTATPFCHWTPPMALRCRFPRAWLAATARELQKIWQVLHRKRPSGSRENPSGMWGPFPCSMTPLPTPKSRPSFFLGLMFWNK